MLAKLGNGIQRHVVLERQSAYLAKKPNNKAVSITAYLTKKPNNKAISITTKQSSSQLVNQWTNSELFNIVAWHFSIKYDNILLKINLTENEKTEKKRKQLQNSFPN